MAVNIATNSPAAWLAAIRVKTLTGAMVPVAIALSKTYADGSPIQWVPAVLCLAFALLMQTDANFVNDYFDCVRGIDRAERMGPPRACAQGWVTLGAMRRAIALVTTIACLTGLPLILWGGMEMVGVGAACVVFCFLYTTLLAQRAMGDVLVVVFFGLVPVGATYYLQTQQFTTDILLLALGCGLVTDCLLIVNNYRDRHTDRACGKRTLVTLIGEKATEWLYLALGAAACACAVCCLPWPRGCALTGWLLLFAALPWHRMKAIHHGRALNGVLGLTSLFILAYGIVVSLALLSIRLIP